MHKSGDLLSHFRLLEQIGGGRRGHVWKATDSRDDRLVAIRVLPPIDEPHRMERLKREIAEVAALDHPHIESVEPVAEHDGAHFVCMELVDGPTLARLIPTGGLSSEKLLQHALRLTEAVGHAHRHGVTHRDLTPSRIAFDDQGQLRVTGFGLDEIREREVVAEVDPDAIPTLTSDHEITDRASLPYMAPEWIKGLPLDARTDVFSLGVILYELSTGQRPFRGESLADLVVAIIHDRAAPVTELNPALAERLAEIVQTSLEKDPAQRFPTAAELHEQLARL